MDPRKIIKVLNSREEDSKRLDAILESMKINPDIADLTILYFPNNYSMYYDAEFKVFQVDNSGTEIQVFKDGREAIDFCLHNDEYEEELRQIQESSSEIEEKNSDVGIAPTDERGIENIPQIDVVKSVVEQTPENQEEKKEN